jgi:hypothetical protein
LGGEKELEEIEEWDYRGVRLDGWTAQAWIKRNLDKDVPFTNEHTQAIYQYCRVGPEAYRRSAKSDVERDVLIWMAYFLLQLKPLYTS